MPRVPVTQTRMVTAATVMTRKTIEAICPALFSFFIRSPPPSESFSTHFRPGRAVAVQGDQRQRLLVAGGKDHAV